MEVLKGVCAIISLIVLIMILLSPIIMHYKLKRDIKAFYDSIDIGDGFEDPYYANDPFSKDKRVIEVIGKQDNYILYEVNWYDRLTNLKSKNYKPHTESMSVDRFFILTENYKRVMIFD